MPTADIGPCPFCASAAIAVVELDRRAESMVSISCTACDAVGPPLAAREASAAIGAWNRRGPVYYPTQPPGAQSLLACPFCGGTQLWMVEYGEQDGRVAVSCRSCEALGPPALAIAPSAAEKAWNRRLLPD